MRNFFLIAVLFSISMSLYAQESERREKMTIDGELVSVLITETNDTILIADLDDVSVSSPRKFENKEDYRRYLKYRRYANKVYPYAVEAIKIFKETEYVTQNMKPKKRKKHIKRLNKELKKEFKDPLKGLTRTQGKILVKMIEKELDTPFYDLMKSLRGKVTASYWNQLGKLYGYQLKSGYVPGEDIILDAVLQDFNISYEVDYPELD